MRSLTHLLFLFLVICPFGYTHAESLFRHQFYIGPEIYYVVRNREGGSEQKGTLYGVRLGYDYIRRYAFYVGVDALYAQGTINGENKENKTLKSTLIDANVEGRLGYTFEAKNCYHPSFTPFVGIGYFWETNKYEHPSPLTVHFHNHFSYIPVGFLSRVFVSDDVSIGLNFKARFLIEGKTNVKHDDEFDNPTMTYEEYPQYRVELPFSYYFCLCNSESGITIEPFYEYRHYGHRANFPFDFFDTKFNLYGLTLKILYLF